MGEEVREARYWLSGLGWGVLGFYWCRLRFWRNFEVFVVFCGMV